METSLPTPTTARVYVNLPEGKPFLGHFPLPPGPPRELPTLRDGIQINQQGDLVNCMQGLDAAAIMLPAPPNQPLKNWDLKNQRVDSTIKIEI